MIKNLNILYLLMSGQLNSMTLRQQALRALDVIVIPEKLGMMLSLMLSPPTVNSWEFGDLKIMKDDLLWDFIKEFLREIKYTDNDRSGIFTTLFQIVFNIMRGKKVDFFEVKKALNKIKDKQAIVDDKFYKCLNNSGNLINIIFNSGENFYYNLEQLSADTGIELDLILDVIFLSTNSYYQIFEVQRIARLRNSVLINAIS